MVPLPLPRAGGIRIPQINPTGRYACAAWEPGPSCRWMVTGWLVGFGQAPRGSGASRSRVGGAFGEGESLGARRRRSRWGPFGPFGRRARSARVTGRLVRAYEALGARGASRSRVRGSVGAGAEGPGGGGGSRRGRRGGPEGELGATSGGARPKFGVGSSDVWKF